MTWIFVLAFVLFLLSLTAAVFVGVDIMDGGSFAFPLILIALAFFCGGLGAYYAAVQVERDCYHAGGQVVNLECKVVGDKVVLINEPEPE